MDVSIGGMNMSELKKNEIYPAEITGYTSEGDGVCRIEGRAVFVPQAMLGEKLEVRILKVSRTAVYGKIEKLTEPSPYRCQPECPIYHKCGGCALMHMTYEEELRMKQNRVDDALRRIGGLQLQTACIHGDDEVYHYRNKAIYNVAMEKGRPVTGFFRRNTHDVVPCEVCLIQAPFADRAVQAVREWMTQYKVPAYDEKSGQGTIRHVFARYAFGTGQGQVVLVSARDSLPQQQACLEAITRACPEVKSIVLNVNKTRGNTVLDGQFYTIWGEGSIEEVICGLTFRLSPRSFCQVNIRQAERLYQRAIDFAGLTGKEEVIDLYCGTGTITLCLARHCAHVTGAEIVPAAIADAKENALRNGISNADFICADASEAAAYLKDKGTRPDVLVVDPPRKGLAPDVIDSIAAMGPERVVYVSCDPATLARDLKLFQEKGYHAEKAEAYDLFPRTKHVETVVLMSRGGDNHAFHR